MTGFSLMRVQNPESDPGSPFLNPSRWKPSLHCCNITFFLQHPLFEFLPSPDSPTAVTREPGEGGKTPPG